MFMTPRGLKIRLEIPHGFALLARLWDKDGNTDAFRVLKTCEGLENIPSIFGFIGGLVAIGVGFAPWHVLLGIVLGAVLGQALTMFGAFIIPGLAAFATLWSWAAGFGVFLGLGVATAWIVRGWQFAVSWMVGSAVAYIVSMLIVEPMRMKYYKERVGYPLSQAEINFFNAYRLHADHLGLTRDIEVSDAEVSSGRWSPCLEDYAQKYPEAVARFVR